jgi:hypothetical protein
MIAECRPPPGTPDGTVCWLVRNVGSRKRFCALPWHSFGIWEFGGFVAKPDACARYGWRFHSIATPPEDAK